MTVSNEEKVMDITKITIPFSKDRAKQVMDHYNLSKAELEYFYSVFAKCVANDINILSHLNSANVPSLVRYYKTEITNKPGTSNGIEIFTVSDHLRPIKQVYFKDTTSYSFVMDFGCRLAKIINDVSKAELNVVLRVIDADMIYVDDAGRIILGGLLFATEKGKPPLPVLDTAPLHINSKILAGVSDSERYGDKGTDMYTVSSMLWSLLNGDGFEIATPTSITPKYALPGIEEILKLGLGGDPEMFGRFRTNLSNHRKLVTKERTDPETKEWIEPIIIPVPAAAPCIFEPEIMDVVTFEAAKPQPTVAAEEPIMVVEIIEELQPTMETVPATVEQVTETVPEVVAETEQVLEPVAIVAEPVVEAVEEPVTETEPEVMVAETEPVLEPVAIVAEPVVEAVEEPVTETEPEVMVAETEPVLEPVAIVAEPVTEMPETSKSVAEAVEEPITETELEVVAAAIAEEELEILEAEISDLPYAASVVSHASAPVMAPTGYSFVPDDLSAFKDVDLSYGKPRFLLKELFLFLVLATVIGVVCYLSVKTHMISLW